MFQNCIKSIVKNNAKTLLLIKKILSYQHIYLPISRFTHHCLDNKFPNVIKGKSGNRILGHPSYLMGLRLKNTKAEIAGDEIDLDKPIQFSTSEAANVKSGNIFFSTQDRPWFEYYVIWLSIFVFLIYFTMLREPNDIDLKLERSPTSYLDVLEEELEDAYASLKESGKDTSNIEVALEDVRMQKSRLKDSGF